MKKLCAFLCLMCLTAALTVPASAAGPLEYSIDAPGDPDYGTPTSFEPVATADGGASWVEISLPWTDSGLPYLYSATGLSLGADRRWRLTLTQGTYGEKSAVFSAPALQGPWQWEE